jgi:hypothetical protein
MRFGMPFAFSFKRRRLQMTLRIQRSIESKRAIFILTGRIQAEQVAELAGLLNSESPQLNLVLDLASVRLIDRAAVRFLAQLETEGARLNNCSGFIRAWITQEKNAIGREDSAE